MCNVIVAKSSRHSRARYAVFKCSVLAVLRARDHADAGLAMCNVSMRGLIFNSFVFFNGEELNFKN